MTASFGGRVGGLGGGEGGGVSSSLLELEWPHEVREGEGEGGEPSSSSVPWWER